jgi:hypothetical protein
MAIRRAGFQDLKGSLVNAGRARKGLRSLHPYRQLYGLALCLGSPPALEKLGSLLRRQAGVAKINLP